MSRLVKEMEGLSPVKIQQIVDECVDMMQNLHSQYESGASPPECEVAAIAALKPAFDAAIIKPDAATTRCTGFRCTVEGCDKVLSTSAGLNRHAATCRTAAGAGGGGGGRGKFFF
jgi:hypothetical protein